MAGGRLMLVVGVAVVVAGGSLAVASYRWPAPWKVPNAGATEPATRTAPVHGVAASAQQSGEAVATATSQSLLSSFPVYPGAMPIGGGMGTAPVLVPGGAEWIGTSKQWSVSASLPSVEQWIEHAAKSRGYVLGPNTDSLGVTRQHVLTFSTSGGGQWPGVEVTLGSEKSNAIVRYDAIATYSRPWRAPPSLSSTTSTTPTGQLSS